MCYFAFSSLTRFTWKRFSLSILKEWGCCHALWSIPSARKSPNGKCQRKVPAGRHTNNPKRNVPNENVKRRTPTKDPKRKILNETSQTKYPKLTSHIPTNSHEYKIPIERPQRKDPKRKMPNDKSQIVDPKGKTQNEHTDNVTCWFYLKPIGHIGSRTYRPSAPKSHHILWWQYEKAADYYQIIRQQVKKQAPFLLPNLGLTCSYFFIFFVVALRVVIFCFCFVNLPPHHTAKFLEHYTTHESGKGKEAHREITVTS